MGKEDGYSFEKLKGPDNYKEWAREMTFALQDAGLMSYINGTIRKTTLKMYILPAFVIASGPMKSIPRS